MFLLEELFRKGIPNTRIQEDFVDCVASTPLQNSGYGLVVPPVADAPKKGASGKV
jgi:hypothetical protein